MESLRKMIDEFVASDDNDEPVRRNHEAEEEEKLIGQTLRDGAWEALNELYGCNMKPTRLKIEEAHAKGKI